MEYNIIKENLPEKWYVQCTEENHDVINELRRELFPYCTWYVYHIGIGEYLVSNHHDNCSHWYSYSDIDGNDSYEDYEGLEINDILILMQQKVNKSESIYTIENDVIKEFIQSNISNYDIKIFNMTTEQIEEVKQLLPKRWYVIADESNYTILEMYRKLLFPNCSYKHSHNGIKSGYSLLSEHAHDDSHYFGNIGIENVNDYNSYTKLSFEEFYKIITCSDATNSVIDNYYSIL